METRHDRPYRVRTVIFNAGGLLEAPRGKALEGRRIPSELRRRGCIHHHGGKRRHKCENRNRIFRIITGKIFSDSPINMPPKWFAAIRLGTRHRKGISSMRLSRDIGVTRKMAWRMLHRIGHAVGEVTGMLGGDV